MKIEKVKEETGLKNKDIARFFNLSLECFENSSAKQRYENALCKFYEFIKSKSTK